MSEHWISFFYLYGVGGLLFFGAISLGLNKKVINLKHKTDQRLFVGFLIAYFSYALFHAWWNFKAIGALS